MMDADLVTRAVCSGFIRAPQECEGLKARNPFEKYEGSIQGASGGAGGVSFGTFLLCVVAIIVLTVLAMVLYKRSLKAHMQQTIKEEVLLEVESALAAYNKLPPGL